MKKLLIIALALILSIASFACTKQAAAPAAPVRVAALAGPTGMGLAYMMQDMQDAYQVEIMTAPDQVTAKVLSGEVDIAAVPINLAAGIEDLAGKTVYSVGQGSTPEYIFQYLLNAYGLADSVNVEFIADGTELIAKMKDGSATIALLPEPHVSVACASVETARVALKINDLWAEKNDTQVVQGVYVVRKAYLDSNRAQVDAFLKDAETSANKVVSEEGAAAVIAAQGIIAKEPIAKRAIPNCNICLIKGEQMKSTVAAMLQVLFDANPKSIGGSMPADDFYYVGNPS